jgi:DNA-binding NtrC family response regulator
MQTPKPSPGFGSFDEPVTSADVDRSFASLGDDEAQCRRLARMVVGRIGLKEALHCLRSAMLHEALARCGGSRRGAAALLQMNRRCVQRMVDDLGDTPAELEEPGTGVRALTRGPMES